MNEIEQIIKALDLLEDFINTEETTMMSSGVLDETYIIDTDIEKMKTFLKKALTQLENLEIEVREEQ